VTASFRAYLLVLIAASLWGTIGVAGKLLYGLGQVSPLALGLFRVGVAAPLLGLLSWRLDRGRPWHLRRREGAWWALAMGSMGGYQLFLFAAVERTDVTLAIFLAICTAPVLVALAAPLLLGERLNRGGLVSGGLALAGAALVLTAPAPGEGIATGRLAGNLLALGAAVCWAAYAIAARRLVRSHPPTRITFLTFAGAALLLAPLVFWQARPLALPPLGWGLAFYLGVVPTALAYFLYVRGLVHVPAATSSFLALVEPGAAALLSALLLGERLPLPAWAGVGVLLLGLLWLIRITR